MLRVTVDGHGHAGVAVGDAGIVDLDVAFGGEGGVGGGAEGVGGDPGDEGEEGAGVGFWEGGEEEGGEGVVGWFCLAEGFGGCWWWWWW